MVKCIILFPFPPFNKFMPTLSLGDLYLLEIYKTAYTVHIMLLVDVWFQADHSVKGKVVDIVFPSLVSQPSLLVCSSLARVGPLGVLSSFHDRNLLVLSLFSLCLGTYVGETFLKLHTS